MELPIILRYDETYINCLDTNHEDRIRLVDIDGSYVVSVIITEKMTKKFLHIEEVAFGSFMEAEEYMKSDLGLDLFWADNEEDKLDRWIDYDTE